MSLLKSEEDVEIFGSQTRVLAVRGREDEARSWLREAPCCPLMSTAHHINHAGIMHAEAPYEIVRIRQSGSFMLATLAGSGIVLVDGRWITMSAGQACLLPPFVMNSFKCLPDSPWEFAWVRYEESRDQKPLISSFSPVIRSFDARAFSHVIHGLHDESTSGGDHAALHHWCRLLHHYVLQFAQPSQMDERLSRLWQVVARDPAHDWTLQAMAGIACLSTEHLRRLCQRELGRSPVRQLTAIRLQRAVELLTRSEEKIETIAHAVGFGSIYSFSKAFKAWFGTSPTKLRPKKT
ncbi:MAG: AraC family transcriptional regulator [Verrucomicrobiales bacterium]